MLDDDFRMEIKGSSFLETVNKLLRQPKQYLRIQKTLETIHSSLFSGNDIPQFAPDKIRETLRPDENTFTAILDTEDLLEPFISSEVTLISKDEAFGKLQTSLE